MRHSEKVLVMRRLLLILILTLSFQTLSKADDIRDFQIEGMSIRDSLLKYETKEKILQNSSNLYKIDEYHSFVNSLNGSIYDGYQVHYNKNDDKFIMFALEGIKIFENDISKCYNLRKKIVLQVKKIFNNPKLKEDYVKLEADPSGNSFATTTRFYIDQNSKSEDLQISCFDWADNFTFGDGSLSVDKLTVTLVTDEYFEFLERAYK